MRGSINVFALHTLIVAALCTLAAAATQSQYLCNVTFTVIEKGYNEANDGGSSSLSTTTTTVPRNRVAFSADGTTLAYVETTLIRVFDLVLNETLYYDTSASSSPSSVGNDGNSTANKEATESPYAYYIDTSYWVERTPPGLEWPIGGNGSNATVFVATSLPVLSFDGTILVANFVEWDNSTSSTTTPSSSHGTSQGEKQVVAAIRYSNSTRSWSWIGARGSTPAVFKVNATAVTTPNALDMAVVRQGDKVVLIVAAIVYSRDVGTAQIRVAATSFGASFAAASTVQWSALGPDLWTPIGNNPATSIATTYAVSLIATADQAIVAIGDAIQDAVSVYSHPIASTGSIPSAWTPFGQTITGGDQFGHEVALSSDGETIAIGAATANNNGNLVIGQVQMHQYDAAYGIWRRVGNSIDGTAVGQNFGYTVDLSADGLTLSVGASGNGLHNGGGGRFLYQYDVELDFWVEEYNVFFGAGSEGSSVTGVVALSSNGLAVAVDTPSSIEISRFAACAVPNLGNGGTSSPFPAAATPIAPSSPVTPTAAATPTKIANPMPSPVETTSSPSVALRPTVPLPVPTPTSIDGTSFFNETVHGLAIDFSGVDGLSESDTALFESLTAVWFQQFFEAHNTRRDRHGRHRLQEGADDATTLPTGKYGVSDMKTSLKVVRQDIQPASSERPFVTNRLTYNQTLSYRSSDVSADANFYCALPFLDTAAKGEYTALLANNVPAFRAVISIGTPQLDIEHSEEKDPTATLRDPSNATSKDGKGLPLAAIIGISLVAVVTVALIGAYLLASPKLPKAKDDTASSTAAHQTLTDHHPAFVTAGTAAAASDTHNGEMAGAAAQVDNVHSDPGPGENPSPFSAAAASAAARAPMSTIQWQRSAQSVSSIPTYGSFPKPSLESQQHHTHSSSMIQSLSRSVATQFVDAVVQLEPEGHSFQLPMFKDQVREAPLMAVAAAATAYAEPDDTERDDTHFAGIPSHHLTALDLVATYPEPIPRTPLAREHTA